MSYKLYVDDNYDYMDESRRYLAGEYATLDDARQAAQDLVDGWLLENHRPEMTAEQLNSGYKQYGPDPFIVPPAGEEAQFSAWEYAQERSQEICRPSDR